MQKNRRDFLKSLSLLGAAPVASSLLKDASTQTVSQNYEGKEHIFLFQGDSITDGNRSRNNDWNHVMGHGYGYIISARLWFEFPKENLHFFNRGISGNKITDLAARWQPDTLAIKPDVLSILIGINDVAAFVAGDNNFSSAQFESGYRSLLQQTLTELPTIKFVLCEPFILPVGKIKDQWEVYQKEIIQRQQAVKKLAEEFSAVFVPLKSAFNNALKKAPADYWIWDGIHPMPAGHELIAREWLKVVSKELPFIKKY